MTAFQMSINKVLFLFRIHCRLPNSDSFSVTFWEDQAKPGQSKKEPKGLLCSQAKSSGRGQRFPGLGMNECPGAVSLGCTMEMGGLVLSCKYQSLSFWITAKSPTKNKKSHIWTCLGKNLRKRKKGKKIYGNQWNVRSLEEILGSDVGNWWPDCKPPARTLNIIEGRKWRNMTFILLLRSDKK